MQGMLQAVPMPLRMEGMLSNFHHVDGRKTIQIRNVWTRFFFENRERVSVFKNIRIRVDEA